MFHSRVRRRASWLAVGLLIGATACSKEKLDEMVAKSKEQIHKVSEKVSENVGKAGDTAQQQLQLAGDMQLTLDAHVKASACYVKFIPAAEGRPSVLKLRSYRDIKSEAFPSVLIQAAVAAASLTELRGQTVPAQMYVQTELNGAVWFADSEHPVQLKIVSVENQVLAAQIDVGSLTNTTSGKQLRATAQLNGVLE